MADNTLYEQRIQNLVDATSFREPDKVPVGIEVINWPLAYAGVTLPEVVDNPEALAAAYTKFLDDVSLDFFTMGFGISHSLRALEALGSVQYKLAKDGVTIEHYQTDANFMTVDEYDECIADYRGFMNNKMPQRNFTAFQGSEEAAYAALKKAAVALKAHGYAGKLINQAVVDHQIVPLNPMGAMDLAPSYYAPFNLLFDALRGVKDSLVDLRRRPEKVQAFLDMIAAQPKPPAVSPDVYLTKSPIPASWTIYHSECFLNNKQFDELFFQGFKALALPYMEKGAKYFLKGEGLFLNTLDRYRELPKGSMIIVLDQDDPFEAYKQIGDWQTLATGINTDLMKTGTKQQCLDYVKRCFDTFGPGGGFIFMSQKPLIGADEVNMENLVAVYEFANEYGKK
ncbi:MAG: hypothetical protein FWC59_02940 [Actinomycetia bacterium]|nr:hypothetical protein [Actinomycetes bacterium]